MQPNEINKANFPIQFVYLSINSTYSRMQQFHINFSIILISTFVNKHLRIGGVL